MYIIQYTLVPFAIMLLTSGLIFKALISSRQRLESYQESRELRQRRGRDLKFGANSIALNCMFVVLITPISLSYLIIIPDVELHLTFFLTTVLLYYIKFSMPIFTYCLSNSIFRRELLFMVYTYLLGLASYFNHVFRHN